MNCNVSSHSNIASLSSGGNNSYGVAQPNCVIMPDGSRERNPFFNSSKGISYWGYKVLISCEINDAITHIYIPIYENISECSLNIYERVLSKGKFETVPFDFSSPIGVAPPENLKFVHISVSNRFINSASVYYRFEIVGDFPQRRENIYLQKGGGIISLEGNYRIPGESCAPNINVTKDSEVVIVNNEARINYRVNVTNVGSANLENVGFTDTIYYDPVNITIGEIDSYNEEINIDTSISGVIRFNGKLGYMAMGKSTDMRYSLPIISFANPNTFIFNSSTMVSSGDVITSISTLAKVEVVQFETSATCDILSNNSARFTVTLTSLGKSPESNVLLQNIIHVPTGINVKFTNLSDCHAIYSDTLDLVRLNTEVTNRSIIISCPAELTPNSWITFTFDLTLLSTKSFDPSLIEIVNILDRVLLRDTSQMITLGATPLPNRSVLGVGGETICRQ